MPTDKIALYAYVAEELYRKVIEFQSQKDLPSISKAVEVLLKLGLDSLPLEVTQPLEAIAELKVRLDALEERLETLVIASEFGHLLAGGTETNFSNSDRLLGASSAPPEATKWLSTGEAYHEAVMRGWEGSAPTFRRRLQKPPIPKDLARLGLVADFEQRDANRRDPTIKWLRFT